MRSWRAIFLISAPKASPLAPNPSQSSRHVVNRPLELRLGDAFSPRKVAVPIREVLVFQADGAWHVSARAQFGPFTTRERALIAAAGLVASFRAKGDQAVIVVVDDPVLDPGRI